MLPQRLGDAKENIGRAIAGLHDAVMLAEGELRNEIADLHDRLGNWKLEFFNVHYEVAAALHDGKIPDATTAYLVAEELALLLEADRTKAAGIENKLGYAHVNLSKAVQLLKEEDATVWNKPAS